MRRVGLRGVAAALIVGLGVAVATTRGAEVDGKAPAPRGLLSDIFGSKTPTNANRAQGNQGQRVVEETPQPDAPPSLDSTSANQQRHMNAWFRRVEVCDRLRLIAEQTGNPTLRNQADELEERATAIYRQQTSGLSLTAQMVPAPVERPIPSRNRPAGVVARSPDRAASLPNGRGPDRSKTPSANAAPPLGGSFDQREQAILNGSSMGGK